jgi:hypothetical protein
MAVPHTTTIAELSDFIKYLLRAAASYGPKRREPPLLIEPFVAGPKVPLGLGGVDRISVPWEGATVNVAVAGVTEAVFVCCS